jgi:hypothetical protein
MRRASDMGGATTVSARETDVRTGWDVDGGDDLARLGTLYDFVCRAEWAGCRGALHLQRNGRYACEFFGRDKDVRDISAADVAEYKVYLASGDNSPEIVNRRLAAFSAMMRVAYRSGSVKFNGCCATASPPPRTPC